MKWLVSTFLLLFSTLIGPNTASLPAPEPPSEPPSITVQTPEPEPEPEPVSEPQNTKLYVLMYHHFVPEGEHCNTWTLTDTRLREDLEWLSGHGYETVLPSQLAAGKPLPQRAVLLTFDDGYDSNYTLAYPLLREYQARAVISLIVQYIQEEQSGYLTWDMCREMARSGLVEFGSHTYACHGEDGRGIKRLPGERQEDYVLRVLPDLQASIDLIQENLGQAPQLFAYPNGLKDSWAAPFIQDHFPITLITRHGSNNIAKGLYSLKRYNISMETPVGTLLPK